MLLQSNFSIITNEIKVPVLDKRTNSSKLQFSFKFIYILVIVRNKKGTQKMTNFL